MAYKIKLDRNDRIIQLISEGKRIFCLGEREGSNGYNMKIVVLAGGISTERDVSLSSGKKIYNALKEEDQDVILLDVYLGYEGSIDGIFEQTIDWVGHIPEIREKQPDLEQIRIKRKNASIGFFGPNVLTVCQEADIVFLALHGEDGENGKVQAAFDLFGIKYTGTDYVSAALAMDKGLTKELFHCYGIRNPKSSTLKKEFPHRDTIDFPKVVKVACGGSSVGVHIVNTESEYQKALQEAFQLESDVIVEEYIEGREFSVGVMEGSALPIIEIAPKQGFYDYVNKYQAGNAIETCPAELSTDRMKELKAAAEKVFRILRLKAYARIDFIMSKKDGFFYCLEANTLPGMTPSSLFPQEAAAIGLSYPDLCMKIIDISLDKY